jgi:hypothetical protein
MSGPARYTLCMASKTLLINACAEQLQAGGGESTTCRLLTWLKDEHGIRQADAFQIIRAAKTQVSTGIAIVDRSEEKATILLRYERIYQAAMARDDLRAALGALDGSVALLGLKG